MSTTTSNDSAPPAAPRRRRRLLRGVAAFVVFLAAVGWFVVKPWGERAIRGIDAMIASGVAGMAAAVQVVFEMACARVEQSAEVKALVGEPVHFAPIEETKWADTHGRNELEFTFAFSGPKSAGTAHVVAASTATGFQLTHVDVTGPDGQSIELAQP